MKNDLRGIEKLYKSKVVNFILGKRVCRKCARKAWKNEDKNQSFTILAGICEVCHSAGIVAYIEK
jgi:hypothetical protein